MLTFFIALLTLVVGFLTYSVVVERLLPPDDRETPAIAHPDGVDYLPLPIWKSFLIQLLNIAGLGPIFGALSGACLLYTSQALCSEPHSWDLPGF